MTKHKVILADSSPTTRKIAELSFSEENNIELIILEDGSSIKEQLTEHKPAVLLVDIQLPECSGYEACSFINSDPNLKHTKVFLLKGGFVPIDENQIQSLTFEDILTKPFDSYALVDRINKIVAEAPAQMPMSVPEDIPVSVPDDFPEISDTTASPDEINFSDVKEEIDSNEVISDDEIPAASPISGFNGSDEVQPSEEITQGSQPEKDNLADSSYQDFLANPFADDFNNPEPDEKPAEAEEAPEDSFTETPEPVVESDFSIPSIDDLPPAVPEETPEPVEEPQTPASVEETSKDEYMPADFANDISFDDFTAPSTEEPEAVPDTFEEKVESENIKADSSDFTFDDISSIPEKKEESSADFSEDLLSPGDISRQDTKEDLPEIPGSIDIPAERTTETLPLSPLDEQEDADDILPEMPAEEEFHPEPASADLPAETPSFDEPVAEESSFFSTPLEKDNEEEPLPQEEVATREEVIIPPVSEKEEPAEQETPPLKEEESQGLVLSKDELTAKIEDKLSSAIKEILWEIIPPMAEKIINEEIKNLKSEIDK